MRNLSERANMTKRLYLARHSKSSWSDPRLTDFDRPLNKRGKRDAPLMGKLLLERGVHPELIVSSPAKRALKSAKIIAEEIEYPIEDIVTHPAIYLADASDLLEVVLSLDDLYQEVMLFGHNPGLTELVSYLTHFDLDNLPTSGIVCIDFDALSWREISQHSGTMVFYEFPKKHR